MYTYSLTFFYPTTITKSKTDTLELYTSHDWTTPVFCYDHDDNFTYVLRSDKKENFEYKWKHNSAWLLDHDCPYMINEQWNCNNISIDDKWIEEN